MKVREWLLRTLRWIPQRILRVYEPEIGRSTARRIGGTLVAAAVIGMAVDEAANEWLSWVIVAGVIATYYGVTSERKERKEDSDD